MTEYWAIVRYLPVVADGRVLGYLWASDAEDRAGFAPQADAGTAGLRAREYWLRWLNFARDSGAPPVAAIRAWAGIRLDLRTDEPIGHFEPGDERSVASVAELCRIAGLPDHLVDDRSWQVVPELDAPSPDTDVYPDDTDVAVRYSPVYRGEFLLGYLWASVDDHAAGFLPCSGTGEDGERAVEAWHARLRTARASGESPRRALHLWGGQPEHPRAGFQPWGRVFHADALDELREAARRSTG